MRRGSVPGILGLAVLASGGGLDGQALDLKRELVTGLRGCEPFDFPLPEAPSEADREEASRMVAAATQSLILGDRNGARTLLERAARLDDSSAAIAYQLARTLEEQGRTEAATAEYCRYLFLVPGASDAEDVEARVEALSPSHPVELPRSAVTSFEIGVGTADAGRMEAAEEAFSTAIEEAPSFAEAYYNRAMVRAARNLRDAAAEDLYAYLRLRPDAGDRAQVVARITGLSVTLPRRAPSYSPAIALLAGLLPGGGQLYTRRPLLGIAVLAAAGGAVAYSLDSQRLPRRPSDPPGAAPRRERPYLAVGIGAAVGIALLGAVEAHVFARSTKPPFLRIGSEAALSLGSDGLAVGIPTGEVGPDDIRLPLIEIRFGR